MAERLSKTFAASSDEAQIAGDCWLYGHPFVFEGKRYRLTSYVAGDRPLSVVVTMVPWCDAGSQSHRG